MTKMWIFVFYLASYKSGGPATAEFFTLEACEAAIVELEKQAYENSELYWVDAFCVKAAQ
jgi:hypothetical protein